MLCKRRKWDFDLTAWFNKRFCFNIIRAPKGIQNFLNLLMDCPSSGSVYILFLLCTVGANFFAQELTKNVFFLFNSAWQISLSTLNLASWRNCSFSFTSNYKAWHMNQNTNSDLTMIIIFIECCWFDRGLIFSDILSDIRFIVDPLCLFFQMF